MVLPNPGTSVPGRGAWKRTGHRSLSEYGHFRYLLGLPRDGTGETASYHNRAVHEAVWGIHECMNLFGFPIVNAGYYGPTLKNVVKTWQTTVALTSDGIFGQASSRKLAHILIRSGALKHKVPGAHVWGMTSYESSFDPAAVGVNGYDSGYCQINLAPGGPPLYGHGDEISVRQAFSPVYAFDYTCGRLAKARATYSGKGPELQNLVSIAQHNSPAAAKKWYENGTVATTDRIYGYVQNVLERAKSYPG